ncbi:MAG: hypothetical protein ACX93N_15300 [Pseudohaliea sp.]
MRLTAREIEYLLDRRARSRRRSQATWSFFLSSLALLVSNLWFRWLDEPYHVIPVLAVVFGASLLCSHYFATNPDEKLLDLLERYVRHDPEAVRQLSEHAQTADEERPSYRHRQDPDNA